MNREETIFEQALRIGAGPAREEFLRGACPDDDAMFERLRGLLDAHDRAGKFMEHARGAEGEPTVAVATAQIVLPLAEKPGDRIGRYRLLQKIGEGGCGVVYMAEQEEPVRRRVALKLIKLGMDTRHVLARFEAERQALALMDHPNIAKIFDAGITDTPLPASGHPLPSSDEGRGKGEGSPLATSHGDHRWPLVTAPSQFLPDPTGITPQIENGTNLRLVFRLPIVDSEWEAIRQHPIEPELPYMNTMVEGETFDIGHERVRAVVANSGLLRVIEIASRFDVFCRLGKNDDPSHLRRLPRRFLS